MCQIFSKMETIDILNLDYLNFRVYKLNKKCQLYRKSGKFDATLERKIRHIPK